MSEPELMFRDEKAPIDFGRSFVGSEAFRTLFREGMALVEETAAYLDGPGRDESRNLRRQAALAYASESMRLTTRLMQIASWLLVQRAVAEGEISPSQALQERHRVRLSGQESNASPFDSAALPERLKDLIGRSMRLHARILHLDRLIADDNPGPSHAESPVFAQQGLIRSAFGTGR